jgi:hypothetical protein
MVQVNVCDAVSTPSEVRAVTEYVPGVVPEPDMKPVEAITARPGGNPEAL